MAIFNTRLISPSFNARTINATPSFPTMTIYWNPDQLLQITGKAKRGEIQCSGLTRGNGPRCGFEKWSQNPDNKAVQTLLPSLAAKPFSKVTPQDLLYLAELCLCRDWHANQKHTVAGKWEKIVRQAAAQVALPAPPCPQTAEIKIDHPPVFGSFSILTPPSTQSSSQNTSFSVEDPTPVPTWSSAKEMISNLQKKLTAAKSELDATQQKLAALNFDEGILEAAEEKLESVQEQLSRSTAERKMLAEERRREYEALQENLATTHETHDALMKRKDIELKTTQGRLESSQQLNDEKDREIQVLRDQLAAAQIDNATLMNLMKDNANRLENYHEHARKLIRQKDAELEQERERLTGSASEKQRLSGENAGLTQRLHDLHLALQVAEDRASRLQGQLLEAEKSVIGREVVLHQKQNSSSRWTHRLRGWIRKVRASAYY
ncbi:hypothetical protein B0T25DRAFT_536601 [Lasiosphaeria hispida]|uniref:Uncharacterized protein n=1 Tax=Lasiosphaeria hispida TaxID=260671 RepID=A0AAJ0HK36_9PEZI|nr:hypothetical protein B0T25DRAFT_536601 [Lasiosphaeria hispida]